MSNDSDIRSATGAVPTMWFEDFVPGDVHDLGTVVAEHDEVVDFAKRYDPQWYHLDEEAAKASQWGGLIASGWWTGAAIMRQYVKHILSKAAPDASPGMEGMRWLKAVYVGDTLHVELKVLETLPSSRGDHLGTVRIEWTVTRDDVPVATMIGRGWFHRRPIA